MILDVRHGRARRLLAIAWLLGALAPAGCSLVRRSTAAGDGEESWSELWMARSSVHTMDVPGPGKATLVVCVEDLNGAPRGLAGASVAVGRSGTVSDTTCKTIVAPVGEQPARVLRIGFDRAERPVLVRSNYVDTLHARLARNGTPSRAACRAAARQGHFCL